MTAFAHGGDVAAFARMCGCAPDEVIDLSSNINFITPRIDVDWDTLPIASYPDYGLLQNRLADHYGVGTEEMEVFNGGSAAIFSFFGFIKEHGAQQHALWPTDNPRCVIYSPAYLEYKRAAQVHGYDIRIVDRMVDMDVDTPDGSLVIFVNPSTPDGTWYDLDPLLSTWHDKECTVLIDESFVEFTDHPSAIRYLAAYPNLYILKSMTKFWGAAGIRIGALVSRAQNLRLFKTQEPLWKLSAFDSAYIQAALRDTAFKKRSDDANAKSKAYLWDLLDRSPLVDKTYPSEANYFLVKLRTMTADELQHKLLRYRILIRSCANFDGLDRYHVRIAVKHLDDLGRLGEALDA